MYIRGKGMKHLLPGIGCNNNHRNNQYRTKGKQAIVLVAATIPINRPHSDLRWSLKNLWLDFLLVATSASVDKSPSALPGGQWEIMNYQIQSVYVGRHWTPWWEIEQARVIEWHYVSVCTSALLFCKEWNVRCFKQRSESKTELTVHIHTCR